MSATGSLRQKLNVDGVNSVVTDKYILYVTLLLYCRITSKSKISILLLIQYFKTRLACLGSCRLTQAHLGSRRLAQAHIGLPRLTQAHVGLPRLTQAPLDSPRLTQAHLGSHRLTQAHICLPRLMQAHLGSHRLACHRSVLSWQRYQFKTRHT